MEEFPRIKRLPPYVFNITGELKAAARKRGEDVIDLSMGNPDQPTPRHIVEKLIESVQRPDTHGYSVSKGILRLRRAICHWYKRRWDVEFDPDSEAIVTIGAKDALAHLLFATVGPGDVVAIQGIGGLGHLGVQYARQMGFKTVALGRGKDKGPLAEKLGAHQYIDSNVADTVAELQKLGGARVILATAPSAKAISAVVDGLGVNGNLLVPAAPMEPLSVNALSLIMGRRSVSGCYSGTARDSQDTLEFSAFNGVHPMIEKYPLNRVADAYEQMNSGKVRFRVVLIMQ